MNKEIEIDFRGEKITLSFFKYNKGRTGIIMFNRKNNEFWGNATLQMDCNISNNEIILKSYGDNNFGLYEALLKQNIIKSFRRLISVGLYKAHVCELTEKTKSIINS